MNLSKLYIFTIFACASPFPLSYNPVYHTLVNDDVKFYLITRYSLQFVEIQAWYNSLGAYDFYSNGWIPGAPLYVIVHGFGSSSDSIFGSGLSSALLNHPQNSNIVLVDWSKVAREGWTLLSLRSDYKSAVSSLPEVGARIGNLINYLVRHKLVSLDKVHYIGHSLGAQLGNYVARNMIGKMASITGLDPAGPGFTNRHENERLDRSDAMFVSVVHTHEGHWWQGKLGSNIPSGHVDFYPNGGSFQSGCYFTFAPCNHFRSYEYFIEAVNTPESFLARKCESYNDFIHQTCRDDKQIQFGLHVPTEVRGNYYFKTNGQPPFGLKFRGAYFKVPTYRLHRRREL